MDLVDVQHNLHNAGEYQSSPYLYSFPGASEPGNKYR